jgi:hypothetical protein
MSQRRRFESESVFGEWNTMCDKSNILKDTYFMARR